MEDLISRKAAVEAIEETDWYHINKDGVLVRGANGAEDLPLFIAEDVFEALRVVAPTKQRWIPVTERLPGFECERVLVMIQGDFVLGYPKMDTDRYVDQRWVRYGDNVTHWMPLPEPPEEV